MRKYYKIAEFSRLLNKHFNTVDNWFKQMEDKHYHYIQRDESNEKVYDDLDLEIGKFIVEYRNQGWSLQAIFDALSESEEYELRPFPENWNAPVDPESREIFERQLESVAARVAEKMFDRKIKEWETKKLPSPEEIKAQRIKEKHDRVNEILTIKKVESRLKEKALELWLQKPENERMYKPGLFSKKVEDINKKEAFISKFVEDNFEAELKQEYGLVENKENEKDDVERID